MGYMKLKSKIPCVLLKMNVDVMFCNERLYCKWAINLLENQGFYSRDVNGKKLYDLV
jgi:hypothetical protein